MPERLPPITGNDPVHPTSLPHDHAFWQGQTCRICTDTRDRDNGKRRGGKPRVHALEIGRINRAFMEERDGRRLLIVEAEATVSSELLVKELEEHGLTIFLERPEES